MASFLLVIAVIALVAALYVRNLFSKRVTIPEHLLHHPATWMPNLIGPREFKEINEIMREFKEFPTNINAGLKFVNFTIAYEHIGKRVFIGKLLI